MERKKQDGTVSIHLSKKTEELEEGGNSKRVGVDGYAGFTGYDHVIESGDE